MATELLYLSAFDVTECSSSVLGCDIADDGRVQLILDRTCFYPRGGGQDWDTGTISAEGLAGTFTVEEVRLDAEGVVAHIGAFSGIEFQVGQPVKCRVDVERRDANTRLHSAGHAIDVAVNHLNLPWEPGKAGHYPHMSFVEYHGSLDPADAPAVQLKLQEALNHVIDRGGENTIRFMPVSQMASICPHVPDNLPTNKPARVVIYNQTFGVPCGGTHVKTVAEIGTARVTKIKSKKGVIKVSYAVDGIN